MAVFTYEAMNAAGKTQKGTIEADNSKDAIERIRAQQLFPTTVKPAKGKKGKAAADDGQTIAGFDLSDTGTKKKKKSGGIAIGGVQVKHLTLFTRQLSTLQDAGLPLLRSLQILEQQQKPGVLKNVLVEVAEDVEGGSSLSESMGKHKRAFDRLYVKMVNAGEVGGVLDVILQRLAEFMEKAERLKRRIKGAMIYPIAVILLAMGILTAIMFFIIPKFEEIFADFGVNLPPLTVWLIDSSRWVAGQNAGQSFPGAFIILPSPVIAFFLWKLIRAAKPGKAVTDILLLWTPVLGGLIRKSTIARFTRTLGTLIGAGVPILEAVTITKETSGHYVFEKALGKVHDSVREGESFAQPLREAKVCDPIVVNMIDVGEETGEMDIMLMKIADNYDEEVDVAVGSLVSLLQPLMIVVLGVIIGTIVVAMFLPLVEMINSLNSGGV
ncbi:MAG: type II secretion system F family protein [Planctomycetota bacterium]